jgi:hypothetical protein
MRGRLVTARPPAVTVTQGGKMRRSIAWLTSAITMIIVVGTSALAVPVTASAGTAHAGARRAACDEQWGSKPKSAGVMVQTKIRSVRAGRHTCFDRFVVALGKGSRPGYRARYVKRIIADPSGKVIHLKGKAKLRVVVLAPVRSGFPANKRHLVDVTGFRTFRQIAGAGSFEGITSFGIGVRARLPFRVLRIKEPHGKWVVAVDVAHRWPSS